MKSPFTGFWFATIVLATAVVFIVYNMVQAQATQGFIDWGYWFALIFFIFIYLLIYVTQSK